jgi:imidazolonepropionase-like amidohydrolase
MADAHFGLVVRSGTVVTSGRREIADIGVEDGRIAQLGGAVTAEEEVGAHGLLVLPGGIDAHVHLVCAALRQAVGDQWTVQGWPAPRSAAASSCWPTARRWPARAKGSGCAARRLPGKAAGIAWVARFSVVLSRGMGHLTGRR